jgi:hypothetical protein
VTTRPFPSFAASRRTALLATAACLFLASSVRAAGEYRSVHGADSDHYQQWVNKVKADGYRPVYVNGYDGGGLALFAGVALKEAAAPAWEERHDLTSDQYRKALDDLSAKGFRLLSVSGYFSGKSPCFAAIWVKDGNTVQCEARHGLSSQDYQDALTAVKKDGLRAAVVSGYQDGSGSYRFAALFLGDGAAWEACQDQTDEQYQKLIDVWSAKGYRPASVSVYETGNGPRFAVIFVKDDITWLARHGLTSDQYQDEFNKQADKGYHPVSVCGYVDGREVRYAAVWVKP